MSTNNTFSWYNLRLDDAPAYSLHSLRDESDDDAIRRFTWTLWNVANASARGPVIFRLPDHDQLPVRLKIIVAMFIESPETFRRYMLMIQNEFHQYRTEKALNAMRRENIIVHITDGDNQRWLALAGRA